jgi:hypothetical protein
VNIVPKETRQKGKGIREDYESAKYKKGSIWHTSGYNKSFVEGGIAWVKVMVLNTYKTYSNSGFTNYTFHVRVLEGEKKGKEYRLSNVTLYAFEELT